VNARSSSPPGHAPLTEDDVGGVYVKYLYHCHRQLWLYTRGYRPEAGSDLVAFGEAIDATTFGRKRDLSLDALRIDWVDGRLWVHEVKSARRPDDAHTAQARLYCLALADGASRSRAPPFTTHSPGAPSRSSSTRPHAPAPSPIGCR
jgi:CRISPR-associated exonuclease Cas4